MYDYYPNVRINRAARTTSSRTGSPRRRCSRLRCSTRLPDISLTEVGKEHGPPLLERGDLTPELFQLAVDARQLGPRLPFPEVSLTVPGADEILDLTAEQPQPRVPVHRAGPVLELAGTDRRDDLLLR